MVADEGPGVQVAPVAGGAVGGAGGATATLTREGLPPEPAEPVASADTPNPGAARAARVARAGRSSLPPAWQPGDGVLRAGWMAARAALSAERPDGGGARIPLGGGRRLRVTRRGAVVGAVALVIVIAIIVALGTAGTGDGGGTSSYSLPAPAPAVGGDSAAGSGITDSGTAERAAPGLSLPAAAAPDTKSEVVPPVDPAPTPGGGSGAARPAGAQPRIVWTGSMSVEVPAGDVEPTIRKIATQAEGLGGYLADSQVTGTATTADDDRQSATVTIRVPAASFTKLQAAVGGTGTVLTSTMSSKDVTADYVDLEARLSALGTSRTTYLTLLGKATTVGEILQVQAQIDAVQTQIEQIEGQRKVLADQSDLATLTIDLAEKGAQSAKPDKENGFLHALRSAWHDFVSGLEKIISALGAVALIVVVVVVLYLLYRLPGALRGRSRPDRPGRPADGGTGGTGSTGGTGGTGGDGGTGGIGGAGGGTEGTGGGGITDGGSPAPTAPAPAQVPAGTQPAPTSPAAGSKG